VNPESCGAWVDVDVVSLGLYERASLERLGEMKILYMSFI